MHESDSIRLHQQRPEYLLWWLLFISWYEAWMLKTSLTKYWRNSAELWSILHKLGSHGLQTVQLGSGFLGFFLLYCCCAWWDPHEAGAVETSSLVVLFPGRARWGVCMSCGLQSCCGRPRGAVGLWAAQGPQCGCFWWLCFLSLARTWGRQGSTCPWGGPAAWCGLRISPAEPCSSSCCSWQERGTAAQPWGTAIPGPGAKRGRNGGWECLQ